MASKSNNGAKLFSSIEEFVRYVRQSRILKKYGFAEKGLVDDFVNDVYLKIRHAGYDWDTVPGHGYVNSVIMSMATDWFRHHRARTRPSDQGEQEGRKVTRSTQNQISPGGWKEVPMDLELAELAWPDASRRTSQKFFDIEVNDKLKVISFLVAWLADNEKMLGRAVNYGAFLLLHLRFALFLRIYEQLGMSPDKAMEQVEALMVWDERIERLKVAADAPVIGEVWKELRALQATMLTAGLGQIWTACTKGGFNDNRIAQLQKRALTRLVDGLDSGQGDFGSGRDGDGLAQEAWGFVMEMLSVKLSRRRSR